MSFSAVRLIKPLVFLTCLIPFGYYLYGMLLDPEMLGANPVEYLLRQTGDWALRFILIVLSITPLRMISKQSVLLKYRRMLGLFAFFYVTTHFSIYALLDLQLDWSHIGEDIAERPFITIGFAAWLLLIPLAMTSTRAMMRRLGKRWKSLHQLVYLIAILAVSHYIWLVKKDLREPLIYAGILLVLFLMRTSYVKRKLA